MLYLCYFLVFLIPVLGGRLSSYDQNANFNIVENPDQHAPLSESEAEIYDEVSTTDGKYSNESFSEEDKPDQIQLWKSSTILYHFANKKYSVPDTTKSKVRKAIKYLENVSCLTFKEILNQDESDQDRLYFMVNRDIGDCWCSARENENIEKYIGVSDNCDNGTITHLIIRKLGIVDEHRRPDRDHYIELQPNNAENESKFHGATSMQDNNMFHNLPYDFHSITHMHPSEFAKPGTNSFKIKPELMEKCENATIIQKKENRSLSRLDVFKINAAFGCSMNSSTQMNVCMWNKCVIAENGSSSKA